MFTLVRSVRVVSSISEPSAIYVHRRSPKQWSPASLLAVGSTTATRCLPEWQTRTLTNWSESSMHWHVWLLVCPHILATIWYQFSSSYIGSLFGLRYYLRSPDKAAILPSETDRGCCTIQDLAVIYISSRHAERVKNCVAHWCQNSSPHGSQKVELSARQC